MSRLDEILEPSREFFRIGKLAFPNDSNLPAEFPKFFRRRFVSLDVFIELPCPKLHVAFGCPSVRTSTVAMPEATMNENDRSPFWQHDVRFSRNSLGFPPKSEPHAVEKGANRDFGASICPFHQSHDFRAALACHRVHRAVSRNRWQLS
jgi:hypothetical protein